MPHQEKTKTFQNLLNSFNEREEKERTFYHQSLMVTVYCLWYTDMKKLVIIHCFAILQIKCLHDCANASFHVGVLSAGSALLHISNLLVGTDWIHVTLGKTKWVLITLYMQMFSALTKDCYLNPWHTSQQQLPSKLIHSHQNFRFNWSWLLNSKQLHPITKSIVSVYLLVFTILFFFLRNQLTTKSLCNQHIKFNPFILQKDVQFIYICLTLLNIVVLLIVNFQILWLF